MGKFDLLFVFLIKILSSKLSRFDLGLLKNRSSTFFFLFSRLTFRSNLPYFFSPPLYKLQLPGCWSDISLQISFLLSFYTFSLLFLFAVSYSLFSNVCNCIVFATALEFHTNLVNSFLNFWAVFEIDVWFIFCKYYIELKLQLCVVWTWQYLEFFRKSLGGFFHLLAFNHRIGWKVYMKYEKISSLLLLVLLNVSIGLWCIEKLSVPSDDVNLLMCWNIFWGLCDSFSILVFWVYISKED